MKTKNTHTPGPWDVYAGKMKNGDRIINDGEGTPVAYAADYNEYAKDDQVDANARLIAAAPDLLEAAQDALTAFQSGRNGSAAMVLLAAAIAKAEGGI
jgi:selenophosphate synthetase-related protein